MFPDNTKVFVLQIQQQDKTAHFNMYMSFMINFLTKKIKYWIQSK